MFEFVHFAGLLSYWHCSFDELISKHTEGQITLLVAGSSYLERRKAEYVNSKTGKDSNKKAAPPRPKQWKNAAEYHEWVNKQKNNRR